MQTQSYAVSCLHQLFQFLCTKVILDLRSGTAIRPFRLCFRRLQRYQQSIIEINSKISQSTTQNNTRHIHSAADCSIQLSPLPPVIIPLQQPDAVRLLAWNATGRYLLASSGQDSC